MEPGEVRLKVGDRVRLMHPGGKWKEVTSFSDSFVCLDGEAPVGRPTLEHLIASGRAEVEHGDGGRYWVERVNGRSWAVRDREQDNEVVRTSDREDWARRHCTELTRAARIVRS